MSTGVFPSTQRCLLIVFLLIFLYLSTGLSLAAYAEDEEQEQHSALCRVEFGNSYFASIATTMPIADHAPLAQTGHLYVDAAAGAMRIDQFFRNHRTTLLLDNRRLRGFLFFGERDFQKTVTTGTGVSTSIQGESTKNDEDDGDNTDGVRHHCHVFYLPRKVAPFCVPRSYTVDSKPALIRGVATTHFRGIEGFPDMPLVEQSLYVINSSTLMSAAGGDEADTPSLSFTPWRLEYCARPDLEPHKIAAAPYTLPNWRFFGHPMFDELTLSPTQANHLQLWQPMVDLLTIDFYDVYRTELDAEVFAVPPQCTAVLRHDDATGSKARDHRTSNNNSTGDGDGDAHGQGAATPRLQLAMLQRFLLQWHLLQNNVSVTSITDDKGGART